MSSRTPGALMPFLELIGPPARTRVSNSVADFAMTTNSSSPSSRSNRSPGDTAAKSSGIGNSARSSLPTTGSVVSTNRASRRSRVPVATLPMRIFGPHKSCITAMHRPVSTRAFCTASNRAWCSSYVPCEKLNRATSIPVRASSATCPGSSTAGPSVQTILVRRMIGGFS